MYPHWEEEWAIDDLRSIFIKVNFPWKPNLFFNWKKEIRIELKWETYYLPSYDIVS